MSSEQKKRYREKYPDKYRLERKRMKDNFKKNFPEKYYANTIGSRICRNARRRNIPCLQPFEIRDWFLEQDDHCDYCGSTLEEVKKYYKALDMYFEDRRLQIDRKDNKKGYTYDNMTICCRICNDHKSNFFTYDEFKIVAKKYIKKEIDKFK